MQQLMVDFITSLDGYAAAEGWPGFWGLEGPEYLAWLEQQPERDHTILMGANTYRLMSGFAAQSDDPSTDQLARVPKVVFSSTLQAPLSWANSQLVDETPVDAVAAMKRDGSNAMRTLGSLTLCRSLLNAGLVDRFRVVVFPVITGSTGRERIYDGYPDVTLEMVASRTFDGRLQLLEYVNRTRCPTRQRAQPLRKSTPSAFRVRLARSSQRSGTSHGDWVRLDQVPMAGPVCRRRARHLVAWRARHDSADVRGTAVVVGVHDQQAACRGQPNGRTSIPYARSSLSPPLQPPLQPPLGRLNHHARPGHTHPSEGMTPAWTDSGNERMTTMGKVVFDISMSLDGYITVANRRPEEPLGDGGERLHGWAFGGTSRTVRSSIPG